MQLQQIFINRLVFSGDINWCRSYEFDQTSQALAVGVSKNIRSQGLWNVTLRLQFYIAEHKISGGVLELNLSNRPKYKISNYRAPQDILNRAA